MSSLTDTASAEQAYRAAARERAEELRKQARWRADPCAWAAERGGIELWSKQREVLESVRSHRLTVVESCHGVGKTFDAAVATAWWIDVHPPGSAKVVTTAPTGPQVKLLLWQEIRSLAAQAGLPGRVLTTQWVLDVDGVEQIVAWGRKPADHEPQGLSGGHALHLLVILDEADAIAPTIWTTAMGMLTGADSHLLAIGNPYQATSKMAEVARNGSGNLITIDAYESPNWTGEEVSDDLRRALVSKQWAADRLAEWGSEQHPLYLAQVRGIRPKSGSTGVISAASILAKCTFSEEEDRLPAEGLRILGVDVGGGRDACSLRLRQGRRVLGRWGFVEADPLAASDEVLAIIRECEADVVIVDSIGIGHHLVGHLRDKARDGKHHAMVEACNVGVAANDSKRFANLKAELWWGLRERIEGGLLDLTDLDEATRGQLCDTRSKVSASNRIQIESKDDYRKRNKGQSPDEADALVLTFYERPPQLIAMAAPIPRPVSTGY